MIAERSTAWRQRPAWVRHLLVASLATIAVLGIYLAVAAMYGLSRLGLYLQWRSIGLGLGVAAIIQGAAIMILAELRSRRQARRH